MSEEFIYFKIPINKGDTKNATVALFQTICGTCILMKRDKDCEKCKYSLSKYIIDSPVAEIATTEVDEKDRKLTQQAIELGFLKGDIINLEKSISEEIKNRPNHRNIGKLGVIKRIYELRKKHSF